MSKISFSFSLNVMLYMSKIDQIHLRAVMLCMFKMSKMGKEHTATFLYRYVTCQRCRRCHSHFL